MYMYIECRATLGALVWNEQSVYRNKSYSCHINSFYDAILMPQIRYIYHLVVGKYVFVICAIPIHY